MYIPYKSLIYNRGICLPKQRIIGVVKSSKIPNILQVIALWNTCIELVNYENLIININDILPNISTI